MYLLLVEDICSHHPEYMYKLHVGQRCVEPVQRPLVAVQLIYGRPGGHVDVGHRRGNQ